MISIRNRRMIVPKEERYLGIFGDDNASVRVVSLDRKTANDIDPSALSFFMDFEYADGTTNTTVLEKIVYDDYILLTWNIIESDLGVVGTVLLQVHGNDLNGSVKFASFKEPFYIGELIDTQGNYTGDLSAYEALLTRCIIIEDAEAEREADFDAEKDAFLVTKSGEIDIAKDELLAVKSIEIDNAKDELLAAKSIEIDNAKDAKIASIEGDIEAAYTPRLTIVESELAEKATQSDLNTTNENVLLNASNIETKANSIDVDAALNDIAISQINKNYGKLDQAYMSDELLAQMAGTTAINATPADFSIVESKMAIPVILGLKSKNLFNKTTVIPGYYINGSGGLSASATLSASDYIKVDASTSYTRTSLSNTAFYNEAKAYISQVNILTFTTPVGTVFMRLSILTTNLDNEQVELGSTHTVYENHFTKLNKEAIASEAVVADAIAYKTIPPNKLINYSTGKNMFNPHNHQINKHFNASSLVWTTNSTLNVTDFIALSVGINYVYSNGGYGAFLNFYDLNKAFVSQVNLSSASAFAGYTFTSIYPFVKIEYNNATANDAKQLELGTVKTVYEVFRYYLTDLQIQELIDARSTYSNLNSRLIAIENNIPSQDYSYFTEAYIKDKKLICNYTASDKTYEYSGINIGSGNVPKGMSCKAIFTVGSTEAVIALISNPNGVTKISDILTKALHVIFTDTRVNLGLLTDSVSNDVFTYTYQTPCLRDGVTEYSFAWVINGTTITFTCPDGTYQNYTDATLANFLGQYCTLEHYCLGQVSLPMFTQFKIWGTTFPDIVDNFNRQDGAIGNTVTGQPYVQIPPA